MFFLRVWFTGIKSSAIFFTCLLNYVHSSDEHDAADCSDDMNSTDSKDCHITFTMKHWIKQHTGQIKVYLWSNILWYALYKSDHANVTGL